MDIKSMTYIDLQHLYPYGVENIFGPSFETVNIPIYAASGMNRRNIFTGLPVKFHDGLPEGHFPVNTNGKEGLSRDTV